MTVTILELPKASLSAPLRHSVWRVVILLGLLAVFGALAGAMTGEKTTFLFKEVLHLTPSDIGTLALLLGIPGYLQPFIGAWVDIFPFLGYHRWSYYVVAKLFSVAAIAGLALTQQYQYIPVAALLLLNACGNTVRGVIVNAVMVSVGNVTGTFGRLLSLNSFIPILMSIAFTAHLSGYVTQNWSYAQAYGTAAVIILITLPLVLLIDERHAIRAKPVAETPEEKELRLQEKKAQQSHTRAALSKASRTPSMWALVGYVFYLIITPGIFTAQIFYETDVLHFSKQMIGDLGRWHSIGALVGIAVFAFTSSRLPIWTLVWGAWLMDCLSYPQMLLLQDYHSAQWLMLAGGFISLFYGFSLQTLAARLCPPGIEGTIYGLVAASITLAGALSEKFGGFLYDYFGPLNLAHHYNIQHGWTMSLLVGLGFTLLGCVFIPFLPAWTRSNESMKQLRLREAAQGKL